MAENKHTNYEIASLWRLWVEYVDPNGVMTEEEWTELELDQKLSLMNHCGFEGENQ
jgi:hypothetical protein